MDEIKEATIEIRGKLLEIKKAIEEGFTAVSQAIMANAPELSDKEIDAAGYKHRFDALWHIAISDYGADPAILTKELGYRLNTHSPYKQVHGGIRAGD